MPGKGAPPPPPGDHQLLIRRDQPFLVFVDTNVLVRRTLRLPLVVSAVTGDLRVLWTDAIRGELERVIASSQRPSTRSAGARLLETLGRWFVLIPPAAPDAELTARVLDPDDAQHLAAARAYGAGVFLTLDERHLPHGSVFAGVQCWHPDTFLTLFYQQNPLAYENVTAGIDYLPAEAYVEIP